MKKLILKTICFIIVLSITAFTTLAFASTGNSFIGTIAEQNPVDNTHSVLGVANFSGNLLTIQDGKYSQSGTPGTDGSNNYGNHAITFKFNTDAVNNVKDVVYTASFNIHDDMGVDVSLSLIGDSGKTEKNVLTFSKRMTSLRVYDTVNGNKTYISSDFSGGVVRCTVAYNAKTKQLTANAGNKTLTIDVTTVEDTDRTGYTGFRCKISDSLWNQHQGKQEQFSVSDVSMKMEQPILVTAMGNGVSIPLYNPTGGSDLLILAKYNENKLRDLEVKTISPWIEDDTINKRVEYPTALRGMVRVFLLDDFETARPLLTSRYIDIVPVSGKYKYFEFDGVNRRELFYNEDGVYKASDGTAQISSESVMPTSEYSLIQQYTAEDSGHYRVIATMSNDSINDGETLVTIFKNNEPVWKQMCPDGEESNVDVRMLLDKDDVIDVMVSVEDDSYGTHSKWNCEVEKTFYDQNCIASTSVGETVYESECLYLSDILTQNPQNTKTYSLYYSKPVDMNYSSSLKRWDSIVNKDGGYISSTTAKPGQRADSVIEYTIQKDGVIKIDGPIVVSDNSDGVLAKIFLNDELIWSNRVGGERSVKWDEEFGTSYFINETGVYADVKAGDVVKFRFGHWKRVQEDEADVSKIKIAYVDGEVISKTTAWKLKNSAVLDTIDKTIRIGDERKSVDILEQNETIYASTSTLALLGVPMSEDGIIDVNGISYYPLINSVEAGDKNAISACDRYLLIYDGLPVRFGWQELSEINVSVKKGGGKLEY